MRFTVAGTLSVRGNSHPFVVTRRDLVQPAQTTDQRAFSVELRADQQSGMDLPSLGLPEPRKFCFQRRDGLRRGLVGADAYGVGELLFSPIDGCEGRRGSAVESGKECDREGGRHQCRRQARFRRGQLHRCCRRDQPHAEKRKALIFLVSQVVHSRRLLLQPVAVLVRCFRSQSWAWRWCLHGHDGPR